MKNTVIFHVNMSNKIYSTEPVAKCFSSLLKFVIIESIENIGILEQPSAASFLKRPFYET